MNIKIIGWHGTFVHNNGERGVLQSYRNNQNSRLRMTFTFGFNHHCGQSVIDLSPHVKSHNDILVKYSWPECLSSVPSPALLPFSTPTPNASRPPMNSPGCCQSPLVPTWTFPPRTLGDPRSRPREWTLKLSRAEYLRTCSREDLLSFSLHFPTPSSQVPNSCKIILSLCK